VNIALTLSKAILCLIYSYPYFYMDFNRRSTLIAVLAISNKSNAHRTDAGDSDADFRWKFVNALQPQQPMGFIYGCARTLSITYLFKEIPELNFASSKAKTMLNSDLVFAGPRRSTQRTNSGFSTIRTKNE